jgi:hypothetical protein
LWLLSGVSYWLGAATGFAGNIEIGSYDTQIDIEALILSVVLVFAPLLFFIITIRYGYRLVRALALAGVRLFDPGAKFQEDADADFEAAFRQRFGNAGEYDDSSDQEDGAPSAREWNEKMKEWDSWT